MYIYIYIYIYTHIHTHIHIGLCVRQTTLLGGQREGGELLKVDHAVLVEVDLSHILHIHIHIIVALPSDFADAV